MKVEELDQLMNKGTDAMTVKRVFGEPITQDGLTLIPVAKVRGAGGAGSGEGPEARGKGSGAGFGMTARALGTYVIKEGTVRFVPAIDVNRMFAFMSLVAVAALVFVAGPAVRARR